METTAGHSEASHDVDEQSHCIRYDVAFNAKKWENYCKEISDSEEEELKYDKFMDGLNPGEVESDIDTRKTKSFDHNTQLDFTECQLPAEAVVGVDGENESKVSDCITQNICKLYQPTVKKSCE